ncbi:MAG: AgmX/PglI C-terminal domain-containing protein [Myxococcales bacterium]|nr:AgmX/PglI C-terminal domain-containing protein [Myxococcales bacterium]MCB9708424.1 AgmX/PglI C-terminal domain-containing protein [Myxococcales bacterium]
MAHRSPLTFEIYRGDQLVATETFDQDVIKIGKLPSSHLRIEDESVSRMHAVVELGGAGEVFIVDLGSATGTIVNGKRVNKAQLESGDEIQLGETRLVVKMDDDGQAYGSAPAYHPDQEEPTVASFEDEELTPVTSVPGPLPPRPAPSPPPASRRPQSATPSVRTPSLNPASLEDAEGARYGLIAVGPPVDPHDVETSDPAVEVVIMWGESSVLHVAYLSPPRAFYVGEGSLNPKKGEEGVDFLMGREALGMERMPIVVEASGGVAVIIPNGATGEVSIGDDHWDLQGLVVSGKAQPARELAGAHQFVLPAGATATVKYRDFTFVVRPVHAAKPIVAPVPFDYRAHIWTGLSLLAHVALLLLMYFMPPSPSSLSLELLNPDSRLVKYLSEPPEAAEEEPEWLKSDGKDVEGGKGKRHEGDEGQMGKEEAKKTKNRYGIEGPEDNPDPHMAREEALREAQTAGILGVLQASTGAWNSPTSPYGRDTALGNDPMSALGAMMGDQIGENFGFRGLGLRGTGRGGGGTGQGTIGLGSLGTIGHGGGGGSGQGYGSGAGGLGGRQSRVPSVTQGTADVRGSLSAEVIRRVIRRHLNEVRFCYEQQLRQRPDLEGRVAIKFIISPTGAVQSSVVESGRSTLTDGQVQSCIAGAVRRWTFPSPEGGGVVIVTYPFMLNSTGG